MTMVERTDYEKWSSVADCRDNGPYITTTAIPFQLWLNGLDK